MATIGRPGATWQAEIHRQGSRLLARAFRLKAEAELIAGHGDPSVDPLIAVSSLARPGGNITGFSSLVSELEPKRIELIREIVPSVARIAALYRLCDQAT